jgi:hypothetical protein
MAYVLPRAALVLSGWFATYWFLTVISTALPPSVIYFTAVAWAMGGVVCFGYIRKLRREADLAQSRVVNSESE